MTTSKFESWGSSLVAWWLGFWAFTAMARVQSLVGELRSHKPCGAAKKIQPNNNNKTNKQKFESWED